jgi:hypothetical protein
MIAEPQSLTEFLATLEPIEEEFDFDENLPADEVTAFDDYDVDDACSETLVGREQLDSARPSRAKLP